jgi:dUTP pyrophosphatase
VSENLPQATPTLRPRPRWVYLIGQLTDGDSLPAARVAANRARFAAAEIRLQEAGYLAINPAELVRASTTWQAAMRRCLCELSRADGVYLVQPGVPSKGANWELDIAARLGIPVIGGADGGIVGSRLPGDRDEAREGRGAPDTSSAGEVPPRGSPLQDGALPDPASPERRLPFAGPGPLPQRGYANDAGLDLTVDLRPDPTYGVDWADKDEGGFFVDIPGNAFTDIPCGLAVGLPDEVWGMITGRSSTIRRRGLLVATGIIDPGYRGPLYAGTWNLRPKPCRIRHGERLAQIILFDNVTSHYRPTRAEKLSESDRGTRGFGSTGS